MDRFHVKQVGNKIELMEGTGQEKDYIILGDYLTIGASIIGGSRLKLMDAVKAVSPEAAFRFFIKKYCKDVREAQRFYNEIYIMVTPQEVYEFKLSDHFGQLAKFPNPELFGDEDYYW